MAHGSAQRLPLKEGNTDLILNARGVFFPGKLFEFSSVGCGNGAQGQREHTRGPGSGREEDSVISRGAREASGKRGEDILQGVVFIHRSWMCEFSTRWSGFGAQINTGRACAAQLSSKARLVLKSCPGSWSPGRLGCPLWGPIRSHLQRNVLFFFLVGFFPDHPPNVHLFSFVNKIIQNTQLGSKDPDLMSS